MAFLDAFTQAATFQSNNSISQVRSTTSQRLTGFLTSLIPGSNTRIPGALGPLASSFQGIAKQKAGDGVQQIMSAVDVPLDTKVATTNPKIYNNGVAAAQGIWTQVESGNTNVSNIVSGSLEPLTLLKHTDMQLSAGMTQFASNGATNTATATQKYSPYAMDLFRLAPKHKFLFIVEFVFNGGYANVGQGKAHKNEFALVIKDFERPKIKYEYEDNVNYYNFRTKIVKRILHEPLFIKFLDDRQNVSMKFFHEYLKATHPLTNVAVESSDFYEDNGMNWDSEMNSASSGMLMDDLRTIVKEIKVYHLYDFGAYMNVYHFTNPKILEMGLDNWNMHESEGSELTASFGYDGLFMELGVKVDKTVDNTVSTLSDTGNFSMHPMQVGESLSTQTSERVDSRGIDTRTLVNATNSIGTTQSVSDEAARKSAAEQAALDASNPMVHPNLRTNTPFSADGPGLSSNLF